MKNKIGIVNSLRSSIENIERNGLGSSAKRAAKRKEIELLSNTDIFSDDIKIKKRIDTDDLIMNDGNAFMNYRDTLLKPHEESINASHATFLKHAGGEDAPGYSIYQGSFNILSEDTELQVNANFDFVNLVTLRNKDFISNIPSLPRSLVLKGSVSHQEFKSYIDKSIRKNSKFLTYMVGHVEMDANSVHRLKTYFTAKNSSFFVKYCPFCKILVFPKTLLNPRWAKPLGFDPENMSSLASEFYFLVVFNRSVLNSGKYPRPGFINPVPIYQLNLSNSRP
jgi:hypothetical protein